MIEGGAFRAPDTGPAPNQPTLILIYNYESFGFKRERRVDYAPPHFTIFMHSNSTLFSFPILSRLESMREHRIFVIFAPREGVASVLFGVGKKSLNEVECVEIKEWRRVQPLLNFCLLRKK